MHNTTCEHGPYVLDLQQRYHQWERGRGSRRTERGPRTKELRSQNFSAAMLPCAGVQTQALMIVLIPLPTDGEQCIVIHIVVDEWIPESPCSRNHPVRGRRR
jgi:hypothetical protein